MSSFCNSNKESRPWYVRLGSVCASSGQKFAKKVMRWTCHLEVCSSVVSVRVPIFPWWATDAPLSPWLPRRHSSIATSQHSSTMKLSLAVLSACVAASSVASASRVRAPWCIPRGGDSEAGNDTPVKAATSIPVGGSGDAYATSLEAVKTKVLDAANESVRIMIWWKGSRR